MITARQLEALAAWAERPTTWVESFILPLMLGKQRGHTLYRVFLRDGEPADSIEAGLFEPSTVMLPFLEGGDGQTVAETLEPMLSRLGHGNLALSAGKER